MGLGQPLVLLALTTIVSCLRSTPIDPWPNVSIPYLFHDTVRYDVKLNILQAIADLQQTTCIRFRDATDADTYSLQFISFGRKCFSEFGYTGFKRQRFNIANQCSSQGNIWRYLMQTLGFAPYYRLPNRDDYVSINLENVGRRDRYQYKILDRAKPRSYDFYSVLAPADPDRRGNAVVVPLDPKEPTFLDESKMVPTPRDIELINELYGCSDKVDAGSHRERFCRPGVEGWCVLKEEEGSGEEGSGEEGSGKYEEEEEDEEEEEESDDEDNDGDDDDDEEEEDDERREIRRELQKSNMFEATP